jgi:hypothetical protein
MDLEFVSGQPFYKIKEMVEIFNQIKEDNWCYNQCVMNNVNLFILCDNLNKKVLRIFDLNTFDLVKEIDVKADRIKLVSNSYIILFDEHKKVLYLYDQSDDFEKLNQVDMKPWLERDELTLVFNEKSSTIVFASYTQVKDIHFNQLFNYPLISAF